MFLPLGRLLDNGLTNPLAESVWHEADLVEKPAGHIAGLLPPILPTSDGADRRAEKPCEECLAQAKHLSDSLHVLSGVFPRFQVEFHSADREPSGDGLSSPILQSVVEVGQRTDDLRVGRCEPFTRHRILPLVNSCSIISII